MFRAFQRFNYLACDLNYRMLGQVVLVSRFFCNAQALKSWSWNDEVVNFVPVVVKIVMRLLGVSFGWTGKDIEIQPYAVANSINLLDHCGEFHRNPAIPRRCKHRLEFACTYLNLSLCLRTLQSYYFPLTP